MNKITPLSPLLPGLVLFLCLALGPAPGCRFARVKTSPVPQQEVPAFIDSRYDGLQADYSGKADAPAALLFDLKGDNITLTGKGWHPVSSQESLDKMIQNMMTRYRYWGRDAQGPQLSLIVDETGKTIGYLFSAMDNTDITRQGSTYRVAPVTDLDVREKARPGIRGAGG